MLRFTFPTKYIDYIPDSESAQVTYIEEVNVRLTKLRGQMC